MAPTKPVELMPIPGLDDPTPGQFARTARLDQLFAQGFPYLCVLTDEPVSAATAKREAIKACQAIDPYLPTVIPRRVAQHYLSAYLHRPFHDDEALRAAAAQPADVNQALMQEIFARKFIQLGVGETYVYRLREVVFILEAFLGTDAVAEALVEHFVRGFDPARWGEDRFWQDHHNGNIKRVALAFGWLRLRLSPERWRALTRPLLEGSPKLPNYSATLALYADDSTPCPLDDYGLDVAIQRRDTQALRARLGRWPNQWTDAQLIYVLGADTLRTVDVSGLRLLPKWWQQRLLVEMGAIRAPGTLRVVAALLASRSVGDAAKLYIERHRPWIEAEALPALSTWPSARADAANIRRALNNEPLPPPPKPAALKKQLNALFKDLPANMRACGGDPDLERTAMRAAFESYCDIRAALGEVIPEAYFTHSLDLNWKAPEEDVSRWIDLGVDVADTSI